VGEVKIEPKEEEGEADPEERIRKRRRELMVGSLQSLFMCMESGKT
jgi:hypothetical protein